jgi:hypothetical protein
MLGSRNVCYSPDVSGNDRAILQNFQGISRAGITQCTRVLHGDKQEGTNPYERNEEKSRPWCIGGRKERCPLGHLTCPSVQDPKSRDDHQRYHRHHHRNAYPPTSLYSTYYAWLFTAKYTYLCLACAKWGLVIQEVWIGHQYNGSGVVGNIPEHQLHAPKLLA